jgi:hypothetical protein
MPIRTLRSATPKTTASSTTPKSSVPKSSIEIRIPIRSKKSTTPPVASRETEDQGAKKRSTHEKRKVEDVANKTDEHKKRQKKLVVEYSSDEDSELEYDSEEWEEELRVVNADLSCLYPNLEAANSHQPVLKPASTAQTQQQDPYTEMKDLVTTAPPPTNKTKPTCRACRRRRIISPCDPGCRSRRGVKRPLPSYQIMYDMLFKEAVEKLAVYDREAAEDLLEHGLHTVEGYD